MKLKIIFYWLFTTALVLLPNALFAFEWTSDPNDKSIFYLGQVFGVVGNVLNGAGSPLLGQLFSIFNIAVLSLGGLVVSYTIILTTINTAQEGEMMGKKFSSIWIPLRSAIGIAFLLPTASGYSLIQILLMDIVIQGINAANQVWAVVANSFSGGTSAFGQIDINNASLQSAAQSLLNSMVCAEVFNNNPSCQASIGGSFFRTVTVVPYTSNNQLLIGIPGDSNYGNLCGGLQAAPLPANALDATSWNAANLSAFSYAASDLQPAAQQIYSSSDPLTWTNTNVIATAANTLQGQIGSAPQLPPTQNDQTKNALSYGWLFAGSYYFSLIASTADTIYPAPTALDTNTTTASTACQTALTSYLTTAANYLNSTTTANAPMSSLANAFSGTKANALTAVYDAITAPIRDLVYSFLNYLTTNSGDPISSLRTVGSNIMITCELIWITVMVAGFIIMLGACTLSGMQPVCWMIGAALTVLVPILTLIITLLWGIGALLGIYVPLIPYIVYTFTALGWFLLVIESIAAAPIIALGLVSPSAEELGRASPAIQLITNVFLRPSLMVIGFVAASKLVTTVVAMVNFGFQATVEASVTGLGIFGCIALLTLYGGLVLAVIHECFSLIHVLPEKIMRWIGGQAETSQIKQQLDAAKQSVEKGAEMGGGMMKGSASMMQAQGAKAMKGGKGGIDSIALGGK